jgi:hypothetical protein
MADERGRPAAGNKSTRPATYRLYEFRFLNPVGSATFVHFARFESDEAARSGAKRLGSDEFIDHEIWRNKTCVKKASQASFRRGAAWTVKRKRKSLKN